MNDLVYIIKSNKEAERKFRELLEDEKRKAAAIKVYEQEQFEMLYRETSKNR